MAEVTLDSGVTLSYEEQGDVSAPTVVLVPGPTDSWRSYQPVLDRLSPDLHAVALSQRGHGESDKPPTGYTVRDFATDLVGFLDALEIERAVLTGHSGSNLVVRCVALHRPDRVAGLIFEASPLTLHEDARLRDLVDSVVANLSDPIDADFARSFLFSTSSDALEAGLADALVDELLMVPARVWKEMFASLLEYDDLGDLSHIGAPTLLVWGDADPLIGRAEQDALGCAITQAELVVFEGAGHTPRWEDPARFAADLTAFVRRAHAEGPGR